MFFRLTKNNVGTVQYRFTRGVWILWKAPLSMLYPIAHWQALAQAIATASRLSSRLHCLSI